MIRIKTFNNFLDEALALKDARKATKIFLDSGGKQRYNDIFKGSDRLYYDFTEEGVKKSALEIEVIEALSKNGYYLVDYKKGLAKKEGDDKNTFKVQKILNKLDLKDLKNRVDADPLRASSRKEEKKIVISRHGIDLAGQSEGRKWTSCKALNAGAINKHYVWTEIEQGSLIAYLINSDDLNIQNPIARILIGVFINKKDPSDFILYPDVSTYGNYFKEDFMNFVTEWCDNLNKVVSKNYQGIYSLSSSCYADTNGDISVVPDKDSSLEALFYAANHKDPSYLFTGTFIRKTILNNPKINKEEIINLIKFTNTNAKDLPTAKMFFEFLGSKITEENYVDYINLNKDENITSDIELNTKLFNLYLKNVKNLDLIENNKAIKIKEKIQMMSSSSGNNIEDGRERLEFALENLAMENDSKKVIEWIIK